MSTGHHHIYPEDQYIASIVKRKKVTITKNRPGAFQCLKSSLYLLALEAYNLSTISIHRSQGYKVQCHVSCELKPSDPPYPPPSAHCQQPHPKEYVFYSTNHTNNEQQPQKRVK